ncbi:hypothetical protein CERSUDRAFT_111282 [Gelatoporia subvermispora B]|uniref:Uncharacterized protein n=1 Tax=Ceriporiopsis subvermispora (strain B) TaxID=914234 RepID=M2QZL0_CERS8|nr:hypothetical protein CERSUDRAFT_120396 [Gelatoporia subvermispora B]EMD37660.1 hypothetical protein CERSUDRAFT_114306 [Gelatoporia subvermispora B]EMD40702.1 hypothetical protein CERSUDRAFT_111282 [Gelatoporia subvermispora B]
MCRNFLYIFWYRSDTNLRIGSAVGMFPDERPQKTPLLQNSVTSGHVGTLRLRLGSQRFNYPRFICCPTLLKNCMGMVR